MNKVNFRFKDLISLEHEGYLYDLHNDFDCEGFQYNAGLRTLSLAWLRREGHWVQRDLPRRLTLDFAEVHSLAVTPRDPEMPAEEDRTLDHLGYVPPEFRDRLDAVTTEEMRAALSEDDPRPYPMIFAFRGGQVIVVLADRVTVRLEASNMP